jgi:hypothetical protein
VGTNIHRDHSSPLEINGPNCVKFLHHMGKILLNLTHGEPFSLVNKFTYFDDLIELDVLLVGALRFGVHDPINYFLLNVSNI